jgi:hypothetical protein
MIPGLCAAGQMKLVGATCSSSATSTSIAINPANITIPALTGSQIAIIYLELYGGNEYINSNYPATYKLTASASGTGVNLNVALAGTASDKTYGAASATMIGAGVLSKNSAFCTTTTGSQTISFSGTLFGQTTTSSGTIQACVFIYTPPF